MAQVKDRVETEVLQVPLEQMQKKTQNVYVCAFVLISQPNPFFESLDGQRTTEFSTQRNGIENFQKAEQGIHHRHRRERTHL